MLFIAAEACGRVDVNYQGLVTAEMNRIEVIRAMAKRRHIAIHLMMEQALFKIETELQCVLDKLQNNTLSRLRMYN